MVERKRYRDDDDSYDKRRKMGEQGDQDVGSDLVEMITTLNEKTDIEAAIEEVATKLADQLEAYQDQIINILSDCVAYAPEKMTIFSTLVGLLNSKKNAFGDSLVSRLISDLNVRFNDSEYDIVIRIVTFLADLGNSQVLTLDSIVQFLYVFLDNSTEQNLLSDFYVYCIMHALPWIGAKISAEQSADLKDMLGNIEKYLNNRQKKHIKILCVWEQVDPHEQEDYLDSLWAQLKKMQENEWKETHISRYYSKFASTFADTISHNLPSIMLPAFDAENTKYPLPRVVFRLFDYTNCPENEPVLPGSHAIERFLVEEDLNWIINNNYLNTRLCCKELLNYYKRTTVPLNYVIVEVIFSQLFRLPKAPHLELFYGALLIELCRVQSNSMPQVLAQAAELFYHRSQSMNPVCLDRLVNWFSYHLSNFQFRWSWADWTGCIDLPVFDRRQIFVREVFEKCLRLAYHEKLTQILPEQFAPLIPVNPQVVYVLDDSSHPAYNQAQIFRKLIQDRVDSATLLMELKVDRLAAPAESKYDPDMVAVFIAVLIDASSKTFSHTFAAFTKYVDVFRTVSRNNRDMQSNILRTVFDCWGKHKQMLEMLVDKLMKMRIVEPISVIIWVFCEDMRNELSRMWVWNVLNIAIYRLDCHASNIEQELVEMKKHAMRKEKFAEDAEMEADPAMEIETKERDYEMLQSDIRDLLLLVCHNFTVRLSELVVELKEDNIEERSHEIRLQFDYIIGRFKETFLVNPNAMWKNIDALNQELFSTAEMDPQISEVYHEFRSLKYS